MRNKGTFPFSGNFEVRKDAPLDAKTLAVNYADLVKRENWVDSDGTVWVYVGLNVTCQDRPGKVYQLIDMDYTNPKNWKEIGGSGGGVPILDSDALEELGDQVPAKYITIPDKEIDLPKTNTSREI